MFAFIRDVGGDGRDPIEDRKHLEVAREDTMHLGAVDDRVALCMIAHLLQRDRGPQDMLGQLLPARLVPAVNVHLVMDAKAGVAPAQKLVAVALTQKANMGIQAR